MNSKQKLSDYIQRIVTLTEEETKTFLDAFQEARIKRRQFIAQPGFIAQHRYFVVQGAFRAYVVGDEGNDHTIAFAIEDWWITDYNSYIYQQTATLFVAALEDSYALRIDFETEQQLKLQNPHFERIFRVMAERGLAFQQRRVISNLTQSAEERYEQFMSRYAVIVQRLPQYAIASYLGMTPEFLSKIKNNKVRRKS